MPQLLSVRSNQSYSVNYENNHLEPMTEVILLVAKPSYQLKGQKIVKTTGLDEIRFECGTDGINKLIGMLQQALRVSNQYEQMGASLNEIISNSKPADDVANGNDR